MLAVSHSGAGVGAESFVRINLTVVFDKIPSGMIIQEVCSIRLNRAFGGSLVPLFF
jgi:hypothetical protein